MGKLVAVLSDKVESEIRRAAQEEFGSKRGSLSSLLEMILRRWVEERKNKK